MPKPSQDASFVLARRAAFALSLTVLLLAGGGYLLSLQAGQPATESGDGYRGLETVAQAFQIIQSRYVEPVDAGDLSFQSYRTVVEAADPYGSYLSPEEAKTWTRGPEAHPGMLVVKRGGYAFVAGVRPRSFASRAGVQAGTFLRLIDGKSTRTMTLHEIRRALAGPDGSAVKVTVRNAWDGSERALDLVRENDPRPSWSVLREKDGAVLLRPGAWGGGAARDLKVRLEEARLPEGAPLLLDLRGMASFDFEEALRAAELFLGAEEIARLRTREGEKVIHADSRPLWRPERGAILLDHSTAGGPELLAAALSKHLGLRLVGRHTMGVAMSQELIALPSGSALWLSTAEYLLPGGEELDGKGLKPDEEIEDKPETPADEILDAARAWLKKGVDSGAEKIKKEAA
jgi:carboxyl-terminal processing protease